MIPLPNLPRWQQYLLVIGAALAIATGICLHLRGHQQVTTLMPLVLPLILWWPQPPATEQRLFWWLCVAVLFALVAGLLLLAKFPASWPVAPSLIKQVLAESIC
ncbi:hypothetical protein [Hymenobacter mucosus]|uniref:Uncharacterized protein n=1 Tax=Hymenobacter mucosus TaxID=1411120 RepID=A0A238ZE69_9BACT|nr:hypothetical protein [Hymenobacter mucosus]SNR81053.1 hypothetical protein SAMN06269173_107112 [Hymenobacter mucosus]